MYNFVTLNLGAHLSHLTLILLAAGSSSRFGTGVKKQWLRVGELPLWQYVADKFESTGYFDKIIVTSSADEIKFMKYCTDYTIIEGAQTRQGSLKNALAHVDTEYVLVSDVARACVSEAFLHTILSYIGKSDCIVPYLPISDTVVYGTTTINRELVKRVQTPQLSRTSALHKALSQEEEFTDESSAIVASGGTREFILGEESAHKITHAQDLQKIPCLIPPSQDILSGVGFDVHAFDENAQMYLGGVKIDVPYGFLAHSDGDVAIHALIDALLGAAGMGDIGILFPDTDVAYKGINSKELLSIVVNKLRRFGYIIVNVDITIAAQQPKLGDYKMAMRKTLAPLLNIHSQKVNIKATTTEKLGFIGRSEGVGVIANANLKYFDWTKI
ncbi:MAG: bifunctional 2-C-methyl-D-erythritol 4-phosphate cytidylyltransferase/2-C-methyl-D-erythritol 2,4-cyclodiphosphate synthase [Sulfurimonas sp.]|uniref:bifunctional 2-C-methyl-D-erythritol 4-phosphate cytidylyltransferase/2-C-methyl-D-erythritol 2,4-cyclodiphosphate synthase n=1 Tax=Sulfurimonas sp. TaxID=2022749 RepID=UPI00263A2414|nr:bifunctional 2-C-methyl-D-erythritol 4-phosphate cytidylyltransferase/2-C-methyl-D-erythritol 2,4-cyclodiphosphate synthase [Sulfurimonas sp.]MDD2652828.1 bifunctional 2-C-methyl-D-erythritol 4-phosphate cytidylyltransferase/2-C-methyl-D-erythritol 2,4-cyclodiphosphate synthase [Sulfurimonas sp.]MDD3450873.1 bifunctional 2-C-methyl-D-erythritol 4-phosphate cytidylyltransferase/2-C-methyl-D-erythritol 2,4-cyclodiphosphate synthase [Sulfurimonas sp.]